MILIFIIYSLLALVISSLMGALSILYYIPSIGMWLKSIGFYMPQLRAIHTTFAISWIYLSAIASVEFFLAQTHPLRSPQQKRRALLRLIVWGLAGFFALLTLAMGIFTGREYVEYHPLISVPIFIGWLLFSFDLIQRTKENFWSQPVYIYMWVISSFVFTFSYIEGHLWILQFFFFTPIG